MHCRPCCVTHARSGGGDMKYPKSYGRSYQLRHPDMSRCAADVSSRDGWGSHQCSRKATYDWDDELGQFTTCKTHSAKVTAERIRAADERSARKQSQFRDQFNASRYRKALEQIAAGHNDPRALAKETLK